MNTTRPLHPEDDDDPTGIRALLASLPDPGPMPPDLIARISTSIEHEQAALDRDEAPGPVVTPLVRRRPLWQRAGLVAAGLVVVGAAGSTLTGTSPADLAARLTTSSTSSDAAAASSADEGVGDTAGADSGTEGTGDPEPQGDPVSPVPEGSPDDEALTEPGTPLALRDGAPAAGTAYTTAALASQATVTVARWLRSSRGLVPPADDDAAGSPLSTPDGLRDCLTALLVPADDLVGAELATLDGGPAALLVVRSGSGTVAYAVRPDCHTGAPGVLAGPVQLP